MNTTATIARGPLTALHRRGGATLKIVDCWEVAVRYPQEPAADENAIVDLSHQQVGEIGGRRTDEILKRLCADELAIRDIRVIPNLTVYRLTDERAIVFGDQNVDEAVDVTGGWCSLALFGPNAIDVLNKVTAFDHREKTLSINQCCQGPIFGVNTLIGHFDNRYELHACPDTFEFLWQVLVDAGQEFNLKPAGTQWIAD